MKSRVLVLGLGNELMGDDYVGIAAARALRKEIDGQADVIETSQAGLALMELLEGYERALLLDAVVTGGCAPGTVLEFLPENFQRVIAPSPHYAGLPEILQMAEHLQIPFPKEIRILALEVENPYEVRQGLSPVAQKALPGLLERARHVLQSWM